jgi:hypothetical protein
VARAADGRVTAGRRATARDTDAGRYDNAAAADAQRALEVLEDPCRNRSRGRAIADFRKKDEELVPAEPRYHAVRLRTCGVANDGPRVIAAIEKQKARISAAA